MTFEAYDHSDPTRQGTELFGAFNLVYAIGFVAKALKAIKSSAYVTVEGIDKV